MAKRVTITNKRTGRTLKADADVGFNVRAAAQAAGISEPGDTLEISGAAVATVEYTVPLSTVTGTPSVITGSPVPGGTLTLPAFTWSGTVDTIETRWAQQVGSEWVPVPSETGGTLALGAARTGGVFRGERRARDAGGAQTGWFATAAVGPVVSDEPAIDVTKPSIRQTSDGVVLQDPGSYTAFFSGGANVGVERLLFRAGQTDPGLALAEMDLATPYPLDYADDGISLELYYRAFFSLGGVEVSASVRSDPILIEVPDERLPFLLDEQGPTLSGGRAVNSDVTRGISGWGPAGATITYVYRWVDVPYASPLTDAYLNANAGAIRAGDVLLLTGTHPVYRIPASMETPAEDRGLQRIVAATIAGRGTTYAVTPVHGPIVLSANAPITVAFTSPVPENMAEGALLGPNSGISAGAVVTLDGAGGRFVLAAGGAETRRGLVPLDYDTATELSPGVRGYRLTYTQKVGAELETTSVLDVPVSEVASFVTANTISQNGIPFAWTGVPRRIERNFDGSCTMIVPDGVSVSVLAPQPATTGSGAALRNGFMVNPPRNNSVATTTAAQRLAFDGRTPNFDVNRVASWSQTLGAGAIITGGGSAPEGTVKRRGYTAEAATLYIINETQAAAMPAPFAEMIPPSPFRGTYDLPWRRAFPANVMGLRAGLGLSTAGLTGKPTTMAAIRTRLARYNPLLMATMSNGDTGGYEDVSIYAYGNDASATGNWNYGVNIAEGYGTLALDFMSETPDADVLPYIKAWIALGSQHFDLNEAEGRTEHVDGGHFQFWSYLEHVGLIGTGRAARIADLPSVSPQNQFSQCRILTSGDIALLAPHNNANAPFSSRLRTISAISGLNITIQGALNSGLTSGDPYHLNFFGLQCRRADGTLIGTVTTNASSGGNTTFTIALSAAAGLAVGNQVYFTAPYPMAAGDAAWTLRADIASLNPSTAAQYRSLQAFQTFIMFVRALGVYSSAIHGAIEGVVLEADEGTKGMPKQTGTYGASAASYIGNLNYNKAFWDRHRVRLGIGGAVQPVPVVSTMPVVSGTFAAGQNLSSSTGAWTNSPTGYAYQWYTGTPASPTAIPGATGANHLLTSAQVATGGVFCGVVASNSGGPSVAAASNRLTSASTITKAAFAMQGQSNMKYPLTTTKGSFWQAPFARPVLAIEGLLTFFGMTDVGKTAFAMSITNANGAATSTHAHGQVPFSMMLTAQWWEKLWPTVSGEIYEIARSGIGPGLLLDNVETSWQFSEPKAVLAQGTMEPWLVISKWVGPTKERYLRTTTATGALLSLPYIVGTVRQDESFWALNAPAGTKTATPAPLFSTSTKYARIPESMNSKTDYLAMYADPQWAQIVQPKFLGNWNRVSAAGGHPHVNIMSGHGLWTHKLIWPHIAAMMFTKGLLSQDVFLPGEQQFISVPASKAYADIYVRLPNGGPLQRPRDSDVWNIPEAGTPKADHQDVNYVFIQRAGEAEVDISPILRLGSATYEAYTYNVTPVAKTALASHQGTVVLQTPRVQIPQVTLPNGTTVTNGWWGVIRYTPHASHPLVDADRIWTGRAWYPWEDPVPSDAENTGGVQQPLLNAPTEGVPHLNPPGLLWKFAGIDLDGSPTGHLVSSSITVSLVADTTGPVLAASPTDDAVGSNGATATFSTDTGEGTTYVVATAGTASAAPTGDQMIARTGGGIVASNTKAMTATGSQTIAINSGLSASTGYRLHIIQVDAAGNRSNIVSGAGGFTTGSVAAPVTISQVGQRSAFSPADLTTGYDAGVGAGLPIQLGDLVVMGFEVAAGIDRNPAITTAGYTSTSVISPVGVGGTHRAYLRCAWKQMLTAVDTQLVSSFTADSSAVTARSLMVLRPSNPAAILNVTAFEGSIVYGTGFTDLPPVTPSKLAAIIDVVALALTDRVAAYPMVEPAGVYDGTPRKSQATTTTRGGTMGMGLKLNVAAGATFDPVMWTNAATRNALDTSTGWRLVIEAT